MNEQRRAQRFEMHLPLSIWRGGRPSPDGPCETQNLSSGGVLFVTAMPIEVGELIEYDIELPATASKQLVRLHCRGKVLRRQVRNGSGLAEVAATLERYEFLR